MDFIKKLFGGAKGPSVDINDNPATIEALCDNRLSEVAALLAEAEAKAGSKRGSVDWSKGMPENLLKQADYLIKRKYPDLPGYTATQQKRVGSALALCVMRGTPKTEIPGRMREVMGGHFFESVELAEFCRENPCGTYLVKTDPQLLYWFTRLQEAYNAVRLEELKARKEGDGIQIPVAKDDQCRLCKPAKSVFRWAELDELPKLPRHWGCRCVYEPFAINR